MEALAAAGAVVVTMHMMLDSPSTTVSDSAITILNRFGSTGPAARQHLADVSAVFA